MPRVVAAGLAVCALLASGGGAGAFMASASEEELRCLALNIYWEGRSEPEEGQLAVAHVTLNRVAHPDFPDTICEVVHQEDGEGRCQFSWWCDGLGDEPAEADAWSRSEALARRVVAHPSDDPTFGALYYHASTVDPVWTARMRMTAEIGEHTFYR
jgi:spore germination cell wall hydrolase CwlJ-like protein